MDVVIRTELKITPYDLYFFFSHFEKIQILALAGVLVSNWNVIDFILTRMKWSSLHAWSKHF